MPDQEITWIRSPRSYSLGITIPGADGKAFLLPARRSREKPERSGCDARDNFRLIFLSDALGLIGRPGRLS